MYTISLICFHTLIQRELYLFFKGFLGKFLNIFVMSCTWTIVFGYLFPDPELQNSYGAFIFVGIIACFGQVEAVARATSLAQDITDKKIANFLILPMSSTAVFTAMAIAWSISSSLLAICIFPVGKLILQNKFTFSHFSVIQFPLIFFTANLLHGFFALWLSSLVTSLRNTTWIWARVLNPLFMFSGYFYTWKSIYTLSPKLSYLHFPNPLLFALEGMKASVFGQTGYLPFWACFFALWGFIFVFLLDAIRRFKKRIDYV